MQTVDILKKLITEAEGMEYTEWYFRTEESISNIDIFVSNYHIFQIHFRCQTYTVEARKRGCIVDFIYA